MSFETLRKAVTNQFLDNWVYTAATKVDHGDNHKFTPPADGSPWVRLTIVPFTTNNAEIGTNFQRTEGVIVVQCFVGINTGEKVLNEMIDAVVSVFQNKNFGNVSCYATTPVKVGEQKNWHQRNAQTQFKYDVFS